MITIHLTNFPTMAPVQSRPLSDFPPLPHLPVAEPPVPPSVPASPREHAVPVWPGSDDVLYLHGGNRGPPDSAFLSWIIRMAEAEEAEVSEETVTDVSDVEQPVPPLMALSAMTPISPTYGPTYDSDLEPFECLPLPLPVINTSPRRTPPYRSPEQRARRAERLRRRRKLEWRRKCQAVRTWIAQGHDPDDFPRRSKRLRRPSRRTLDFGQ